MMQWFCTDERRVVTMVQVELVGEGEGGKIKNILSGVFFLIGECLAK